MSGFERVFLVIEIGLQVGFFLAAVVFPVLLVCHLFDRARKK